LKEAIERLEYGKSGERLICCGENHWEWYFAENCLKLDGVSIMELDRAVWNSPNAAKMRFADGKDVG
jgi:hypothetical protein